MTRGRLVRFLTLATIALLGATPIDATPPATASQATSPSQESLLPRDPDDRDVAIVLVPRAGGGCDKLTVPPAEGKLNKYVRFQIYNYCSGQEVEVELRLPDAFDPLDRRPSGKGRPKVRTELRAKVRADAVPDWYPYMVLIGGVPIDPVIEIKR